MWNIMRPDKTEYTRKTYATSNGTRRAPVRPKEAVKHLWTAVVPDRFARKTFARVTPSGRAVAAMAASDAR